MLYNTKALIHKKYKFSMETATILIIFVSSLLLGITRIQFILLLDPHLKTYAIPSKNMKIKKIKPSIYYFLIIRGVSLKKTAKKITINVPISKNV